MPEISQLTLDGVTYDIKDTWARENASKTEIVDNLLSNDSTKALSANQGRILKSLIDQGGGGGSREGALVYKGEVNTKSDLPFLSEIGDTYKVKEEGSIYTKTSSGWVEFASEGSFSIGNKKVDLKEYIDSRIFIGTQAEADSAMANKKIDNSTLVIITDQEDEELIAIPDSFIEQLFNK